MLILGKGSISPVSLEGYSVDDDEVLYVIGSDGAIKSIDNEGQEVPLSVTPSALVPSLSEYANVITVDAAGNGNYTKVGDAVNAAPAYSIIHVFSSLPDTAVAVTIDKVVTIIGQGGLLPSGVLDADGALWTNSAGIILTDSAKLELLNMSVYANITSQATGATPTLSIDNSFCRTKISAPDTTRLNLYVRSSKLSYPSSTSAVVDFDGTTGQVFIDLENSQFIGGEFTSFDIRLGRAVGQFSTIDNCYMSNGGSGADLTLIVDQPNLTITGSRFRSGITASVAVTLAMYSCVFGNRNTNISVAAGNYSNIYNGVTWPVIP